MLFRQLTRKKKDISVRTSVWYCVVSPGIPSLEGGATRLQYAHSPSPATFAHRVASCICVQRTCTTATSSRPIAFIPASPQHSEQYLPFCT